MVIIGLDGGMGNQMFQYAMGRHLARKLNTELKLDIENVVRNKEREYSLSHFEIKEQFCSKAEKKSMKKKEFLRRQLNKIGFSISPYWYTEASPGYLEDIQKVKNNIYLEGFWQSDKYFTPIETIIREQFVVRNKPSEMNAELLEKI